MSKRKLRRLGARIYKHVDGKLVEVTDVKTSNNKASGRYKSPAVVIFKEEWYEHIADHPIFITSKKQLREECEKRGMIAKALD